MFVLCGVCVCVFCCVWVVVCCVSLFRCDIFVVRCLLLVVRRWLLCVLGCWLLFVRCGLWLYVVYLLFNMLLIYPLFLLFGVACRLLCGDWYGMLLVACVVVARFRCCCVFCVSWLLMVA